MDVTDYLPQRVNSGNWLTGYTLYELRRRDPSTDIVLPICSLGTPYPEIAGLGELVLPPLFHEALTDSLKADILAQIDRCFPVHELSRPDAAERPRLRVVELPPQEPADRPSPDVLAFSVDTAVEEHGPHLPLATDTIQSYSVLKKLAEEVDGFLPGPPVEYGQLTWGLPFGFSIDLTAELLTACVTRFTNAVLAWLRPKAIYVVDVHGSIVHRRAIVDGLKQSDATRWFFRWLHEPLVSFASERGDQHAGGVETALVEHAGPELLDANWWPDRIDELADGQMSFEKAVELTPDLQQFTEYVRTHSCNGIVGDIRNYHHVDAALMFDRMLTVARDDVVALQSGSVQDGEHDAGMNAW